MTPFAVKNAGFLIIEFILILSTLPLRGEGTESAAVAVVRSHIGNFSIL
jgi:hypothetical protein